MDPSPRNVCHTAIIIGWRTGSATPEADADDGVVVQIRRLTSAAAVTSGRSRLVPPRDEVGGGRNYPHRHQSLRSAGSGPIAITIAARKGDMTEVTRTRPIVVITGGSAGIGRASVREFAAAGYDVAVLARGRAGLDGAARSVEAVGGRCLPISVDVADPSSSAVDAGASPVNYGLTRLRCVRPMPGPSSTVMHVDRLCRTRLSVSNLSGTLLPRKWPHGHCVGVALQPPDLRRFAIKGPGRACVHRRRWPISVVRLGQLTWQLTVQRMPT